MGFATGTTTFYKTKAARAKKEKKMQQPHHSRISDGIKKTTHSDLLEHFFHDFTIRRITEMDMHSRRWVIGKIGKK